MIAKDIHYIGVNDHRIDLFESQYTAVSYTHIRAHDTHNYLV